MTKLYIDFDGVILDTWELIFKKYYEQYKTTEIHEKRIKELMLNIGWSYIINNSKEINQSLEKIKIISQKHDVRILTKVNSSEEQTEKTKFLQKKGIKKVCCVPYLESKIKYVDAYKNILVDDDLKNLKEWEEQGGISIYFNKDLSNIDSYGNKNDKYIIINDLSKIHDIIKLRLEVCNMKTRIVLTGILKDKDLFLAVKRNENDELYPGAWEFPGGHLEDGETLKDGLTRELKEEIGFTDQFSPIITHYYDEVKEKNGELIHNLEIDFIINVDSSKINISLSEEHCDYKWVTKDSDYLDDFIKEKLTNI